MYKNESKITEDGFGAHTFELTIPSITKEEFERIAMTAENTYISNDGNSICIYPERHGIRFFLNHTENNFYNIKAIVSPRRLIDESSQPMDILRASDDFDMLEALINQSIAECLGNNYCIETFKLSRLDFCVNIMLSESFSAERYVKLLKRSMKYNSYAEIMEFSDEVTNSAEKNKHSFRIRTGDMTFTAYDKYFQLENIGKSFDKISEAFLRLEIAINRDFIRSIEQTYLEKPANIEMISTLTSCSERFFKEFVRHNFFEGDYYDINAMKFLIASSNIKQKAKATMLDYADIQCRKQSHLSAKKHMSKTLGSKSKLKKMYSNFDMLKVYPISVSYRDKHGCKPVSGLYRIMDI